MSIHACLGRSEFHYLMFGWDKRLETYFAQVSLLDLFGARDCLLWEGYDFRQLRTVAELRAVLAPYVELSEEMILQLVKDRAAGSPGLIAHSSTR